MTFAVFPCSLPTNLFSFSPTARMFSMSIAWGASSPDPCCGSALRQAQGGPSTDARDSEPFDPAQGRPFGSAQDGERKSNREPVERRKPNCERSRTTACGPSRGRICSCHVAATPAISLRPIFLRNRQTPPSPSSAGQHEACNFTGKAVDSLAQGEPKEAAAGPRYLLNRFRPFFDLLRPFR